MVATHDDQEQNNQASHRRAPYNGTVRFVWLIALGACYAPQARIGAPCDDDSQCPLGQRCVAAVCGGSIGSGENFGDAPPGTDGLPATDAPATDAPLDVAGATDTDGDGIVDP